MAETYPGNLDIVYAEGEQRLRHNLRAALNHNGYRGIREYSNLEAAEGAIKLFSPDIFLLDASLENGSALDTIARLRHHKLGKNPFLSVIACCTDPDARTVSQFVNCGIDYLVVKPVAPSQLVQRFRTIARKRKAFEVTSDYIGPDRSDYMKSSNGEAGTLIEVPNTVGIKARGESISVEQLDELVHRVMNEINDERLRQDARRIVFLVERITKLLKVGDRDGRLYSDSRRILEIVADIEERYRNGGRSHVIELSALLGRVTRRTLESGVEVIEKLLILLKSLSDAILLCVTSPDDTGDFARKIVHMVQRANL